MKLEFAIHVIGCSLLVLAMAIVLPDDQPQGALPAVYHPDKGCNSCHDIGGYK